ncbi:MAG TPA: response regulator transcription factor [Desulfobacteraceae bacterium]|nr:response regulator transcription factor [Desulfobacteraceae bacterium]
MNTKKIVILDDHRVVIEGVKTALNERAEFEVVGEEVNGASAVEMIRRLKPDIVITDVSMPGMNGMDFTVEAKRIDPGIHVVVFSMYSDREYIIDFLRAGVSSYVLKEEPLGELIFAVAAAARGGLYLGDKVSRMLRDHLSGSDEVCGEGDGLKLLSSREREIFILLAEGLSVKRISDKLNISPKTVESHKYNIMEKLETGSVVELTRLAIRKNLIRA